MHENEMSKPTGEGHLNVLEKSPFESAENLLSASA
jgi:hypothetical protein